MSKIFRCVLYSILIIILTSYFAQAFAADNSKPNEVIAAAKDFYLKAAKDFKLDFKIDSKIKDISFAGSFMLKPPLNFAIEAKSAALEVKIAFQDGNGFIYLPAANIITNLDKLTQAKTHSLEIPKNVDQLNAKIKSAANDFVLETASENGSIKLIGKSKDAHGAFSAVLDSKTYEIKSITTFNKKGLPELFIELKNFRYEALADNIFSKPQGAVETNLPVPVF